MDEFRIKGSTVSRGDICLLIHNAGHRGSPFISTLASGFDAFQQEKMTKMMDREARIMRGKLDARSWHRKQAPLTQVDLQGSRQGEQRDWVQSRSRISTEVTKL